MILNCVSKPYLLRRKQFFSFHGSQNITSLISDRFKAMKFKDCQIERRTKILRQGVRIYASQESSCILKAFVLQQGMKMIDATDDV